MKSLVHQQQKLENHPIPYRKPMKANQNGSNIIEFGD
jgi:hypothetical protein